MPREHGAWGMWGVPFFSTLLYLRSVTLLSVLCFFIFLLGFIFFAPRISALLRHKLRSIPGEVSVVLMLSLSVPVAALSVGKFESSLYPFWICQVLYFIGPIFYVKMKLAGIKFQKIGTPVDKAKMGTLNLGYYTLLSLGLLMAAHFEWIPLTVLVAFLPAVIRAFEGTINLTPKIKLKTVGWKEVVYSLWFGLWAAV